MPHNSQLEVEERSNKKVVVLVLEYMNQFYLQVRAELYPIRFLLQEDKRLLISTKRIQWVQVLMIQVLVRVDLQLQ